MNFKYNKENPQLKNYYLETLEDKKDDKEKGAKLWWTISFFFLIISVVLLIVLLIMVIMIATKKDYSMTQNNIQAITHLSIWCGVFLALGLLQLFVALYYSKARKQIEKEISDFNRRLRQKRNEEYKAQK